MNRRPNRVCPAECAGSLDNRFRRWLQNPRKLLGPYVKEGMKVLDIGCGPGFFSIELAGMAGRTGRVVAADLQQGMLQKIKKKIGGTPLTERIILHKCEKDKIGLNEQFDFVLAFYMVHEVPSKHEFFAEIFSLLHSGGVLLVIEPKWFHVSKKEFQRTIEIALDAGFKSTEYPKIFFSQAALLRKL